MDRATAARIVGKIELLATDPAALANNVRALRGGEGRMRLRVGDWRVIYRDTTIIAVIRIAPRGAA
jgi:mRNA interferase RelE/StbE